MALQPPEGSDPTFVAGWDAALKAQAEANDCMFCNDKPWVVRHNGVKIAEVPKGESRTITTPGVVIRRRR